MDIAIIGTVCVDNNISEHVSYTSAGSPAMFMTKVFSKFPHVSTKIIAPYGRDFLPYTKTVSIYPVEPIGDKTLIYENRSYGNLRSQKALNRDYAKPIKIDDGFMNIVSATDLLFFAPQLPNVSVQYVKNFIAFTKKDSLKIIIPQGYNREFDSDNNVIPRNFVEADELLPLFDFVIVSDQEHKDMNTIVKRWVKKTEVIMTLGDKGATCYYSDKLINVPVKPVKPQDIVDSVGSGDIFSASFGYKYYLSKDIKKSLEFANNIARQCLFYPANNLQFTMPK